MLHAVVLRSSYAHARMGHIDTREALEGPGVVAVHTAEEVKRTSRPFKPGRYSAGLQKPIPEYATAVDRVRYVGEPVAMVAARSRAVAEDALDLISVEYEPLPAVVDPWEAMNPPHPFFLTSWTPTWPGRVPCPTGMWMRLFNRPIRSFGKN